MRQALAVALAAAALGGCATTPVASGVAKATLEPTRGNIAAGSATFTERGGKVYVEADVRGLAPGSEHGFHIHEKGDCSAPDATSAKGHSTGSFHAARASARRAMSRRWYFMLLRTIEPGLRFSTQPCWRE